MICDATCKVCLDSQVKCELCTDPSTYPDTKSKLCLSSVNYVEHCESFEKITINDPSILEKYVCTQCAKGYYRTFDFMTEIYRCVQCLNDSCLECGIISVEEGDKIDYQTKCIKCKLEFFLDEQRECEPCTPNCLECTSGRCNKCKDGYYVSTTEGGCHSCNIANCLYCYSGDSSVICYLCAKNYELINNECVQIETTDFCEEYLDQKCQKCLNHYYLRGNECLPCNVYEGRNTHCNNCFGIENDSLTKYTDELECYDCEIGYQLNEYYQCVECSENSKNFCVDSVFQGFSRTDEHCATYDNNGKCLSCLFDYYLAQNDTCEMCDFSELQSASCYCKETHSLVEVEHCKRCGEGEKCDKCLNGYKLEANSCVLDCPEEQVVNNECVFCADTEYYDASSKGCVTRMPGCLVQYESRCQECEKENADPKDCSYISDTCEQGYYESTTTEDGSLVSKCIPCNIPYCRECSSKEVCITCVTGERNEECYIENCIDNSIPCLECKNGYFLANNGKSCVECKFLTRDKKVDGRRNRYYSQYESASCSCVQNCELCDSKGYCEKCKDQYYLTESGSCSRCNLYCTQCHEFSRCEGCVDGLFLDEYYQCQKCMKNCTKCRAGDFCEVCEEGYGLALKRDYDGSVGRSALICQACSQGVEYCNFTDGGEEVVTGCKVGYYFKENACQKCAPGCADCADGQFCTACAYQSIRQEPQQQDVDEYNAAHGSSYGLADFPHSFKCSVCPDHEVKRYNALAAQFECVCESHFVLIMGSCYSYGEIVILAVFLASIVIAVAVFCVKMRARGAIKLHYE